MFEIASSTALLTSTYASTGTLVAYVLGVIVVAAAALAGLGFGWRHLVKRVTGRKF